MRRLAVCCVAALCIACSSGIGGVDEPDGSDRLDPEAMREMPVFDGDLVFEAEYGYSERGGHVGARVTVTNVGDEPLVGRTGSGGVWWFEAYDDPARTGTPVWSALGRNPRDISASVDIQPGESHVLGGARLIIADSVPAGTYHFLAALVLSDPDMRTALLPAGEAEIR